MHCAVRLSFSGSDAFGLRLMLLNLISTSCALLPANSVTKDGERNKNDAKREE